MAAFISMEPLVEISTSSGYDFYTKVFCPYCISSDTQTNYQFCISSDTQTNYQFCISSDTQTNCHFGLSSETQTIFENLPWKIV